MPVQVEISSGTFRRLQALAVPLVDNMEAVLTRLVDFYEKEHSPAAVAAQRATASDGRLLDPAAPPNLRHAKMVAASIDGRALAKPTWNGLMEEAARIAKKRAQGSDDLRRLIIVPFVSGRKEDDGYKFLPDIDLSVQRQDSNSAWKAAFHVAKQLRLSIDASLVWRHKKDAAFPGEAARLRG